MFEAESFRAALAGVQPPEIDGQLPRDGDDGFLSGSAGGLRSAGEEAEALLYRWVARLESD